MGRPWVAPPMSIQVDAKLDGEEDVVDDAKNTKFEIIFILGNQQGSRRDNSKNNIVATKDTI